MRQFSLLLLVFLLSTPLWLRAQTPGDLHVWGDAGRDEKALGVYVLGDAVYTIGYTTDGPNGGSDITLSKLQTDGQLLWTQYYGGHDEDYAMSFAYQEGVFYVVGELHRMDTHLADAALYRIDTSGALLGVHFYGEAQRNEQFAGIFADGDGWLLAGYASDDGGNLNAYFMRLDGQNWAQPAWQRSYGTDGGYEVAMNLLPLPDGSGYIGGGDKGIQGGIFQTCVWRLDASGNLLWDFVLPFPYNGGCKASIINDQGQLVLIGEAATATSSHFDVYFMRMRTDAPVLLHSNTVPGSDKGDAGFQILQRGANDYVVCGYSFNEAAGNTDAFLMALDSMGHATQPLYIGTPLYDIAVSLAPAPGGGFWLAGGSGSDYLLAYAQIAPVPTGWSNAESQPEFALYPVPASDELRIKGDISNIHTMRIYNQLGLCLPTESVKESLCVEQLPAGRYILECTDLRGKRSLLSFIKL